MLAYFVHHFSPFVFEFRDGVGLRWYGVAYVAAFLLGYQLYHWLAKKGYTQMPPEQVSDFITWAAVFGVMLGGRLGWIIFYGLKQDHAEDPWWWPVEVWKGGMASHGGIIGLVLFTLYWARRYNLSWTSIGDSLCVVAPIGLFLVRLANFINGELYGKPATVAWAIIFPAEPEFPRHPSQLYEAGLEGILLFAVLAVMVRMGALKRPGLILGSFIAIYGLARIAAEFFREPDPQLGFLWGGLTMGMLLSVPMIIAGAILIVMAWRKAPAHLPQSI